MLYYYHLIKRSQIYSGAALYSSGYNAGTKNLIISDEKNPDR